jgi:hypothetical protein
VLPKLLAIGVIGVVVGYFGRQSLERAQMSQEAQTQIQELNQKLSDIHGQYTDLAKEMEEKTCFAGGDDPEYQKVRLSVIETLTPYEVDTWQKVFLEKRAKFLIENQDIWRNDWTEDAASRFDESLALSLKGTLEGKLNFKLPAYEEYRDFTFKLVIQGFQDGRQLNRFEYKAVKGSYSSSTEFQFALVGTNSEAGEVILLFDAPTASSSESPYSHYAIKLPGGLKKKAMAEGVIYGLNIGMEWEEAGKFSGRKK